MCLAGWPVLSGIAPTVEALTESLINMTPLKPSPEEVCVRERGGQSGRVGVWLFAPRWLFLVNNRCSFVGWQALACNSRRSFDRLSYP